MENESHISKMETSYAFQKQMILEPLIFIIIILT